MKLEKENFKKAKLVEVEVFVDGFGPYMEIRANGVKLIGDYRINKDGSVDRQEYFSMYPTTTKVYPNINSVIEEVTNDVLKGKYGEYPKEGK